MRFEVEHLAQVFNKMDIDDPEVREFMDYVYTHWYNKKEYRTGNDELDTYNHCINIINGLLLEMIFNKYYASKQGWIWRGDGTISDEPREIGATDFYNKEGEQIELKCYGNDERWLRELNEDYKEIHNCDILVRLSLNTCCIAQYKKGNNGWYVFKKEFVEDDRIIEEYYNKCILRRK